jgi:hypothetical protein
MTRVVIPLVAPKSIPHAVTKFSQCQFISAYQALILVVVNNDKVALVARP